MGIPLFPQAHHPLRLGIRLCGVSLKYFPASPLFSLGLRVFQRRLVYLSFSTGLIRFLSGNCGSDFGHNVSVSSLHAKTCKSVAHLCWWAPCTPTFPEPRETAGGEPVLALPMLLSRWLLQNHPALRTPKLTPRIQPHLLR